ncbi:hypothetical protein CQ018_19375 [Arthrobacter sp. MYb227]|uniref:proteasome activator n=1 Tax=Arthrobacter sp. MYb227 TaxID=1848601 RepID=UPI000CFCDDDB|nr:proteasome activator [Arthrobacter sp. MYb227]PQZ85943.1 hypothetical protein CQ018_19375 [Arthrobacter sp. MYb227]
MSEHSEKVPGDRGATNSSSTSNNPPWPQAPGIDSESILAANAGLPRQGTPKSEGQPAPAPGAPSEAVQIMGVGEPGKLMRIGGMIKQLLDEVRSAPLDEEARALMADIHERSVHELETGLSPELAAELHRIRLPFADGETPSAAELRVAQAQLVGWLEGVFHGLQAAMAAQQLANQQMAQRLAMRQLPPGTQVAPGIVINEQGEPERMSGPGPQNAPNAEGSETQQTSDGNNGFGQYL